MALGLVIHRHCKRTPETPGNRSRQGSVTCDIDFEFGIIYAASIAVITGQFDTSADT
jgi:hypothetical protein